MFGAFRISPRSAIVSDGIASACSKETAIDVIDHHRASGEAV